MKEITMIQKGGITKNPSRRFEIWLIFGKRGRQSELISYLENSCGRTGGKYLTQLHDSEVGLERCFLNFSYQV